ncbi:MAG: glutathione S-transferase N-terminal domain-containing protein [Gammaproteobacteria bacterium]|nr:glutathione S-transferase N-terminal domain-containing protein [Gammaproteobacteria bacterium]
MEIIRWLLGRTVLFVNRVTWPPEGRRPPEEQARVEQELKGHALYQFNACPFCVKVRREMRRLNLPMELRDARAAGPHRRDLLEQGGQFKVPCLRIEQEDGSSRWMYESDDIIAYLQARFPLAD